MGTVKGIVEILVNAEKTQVRLVYTPKSPGEVWDIHKVLEILERKGINYGINRDRIQEALKIFGEKDGKTRSGIVVQGTEPRVEHVKLAIDNKDLDESLRRTVRDVVKKADPPEFNQKINPRIRGILYVRRGETIGELTGGGILEPGTDIFGNPITSLPAPYDAFHVGRGITEESSGELTAEADGVLRLGPNWMDLIPMEEQEELDADGSRDGIVKIELDSMKTSARLVLGKSLGGGKALSLKEVSAILNKSGLRGIDTASARKEIMDFYNSSDTDVSILLCESQKPARGKDREVRSPLKFMDDSYRELLIDKVELDPSLVSFYDSVKVFPIDKIGMLANVEKDQTIFTISADVKGQDGIDVYGNAIPGLPGNDPILNLYENIDYRNGTGKALISGLLEVWHDKENRTWYARVREHTNAPVTVRVSENKMTATLSIGLPRGTGFPADRGIIMEALEKAGVKEGILDETVDEAAETSGLGEVVTDLVVAEGKFPLDDSRELRLVHDIDYRDKSRNAVSLKAGDDVGYLVSSGENTGYTVTGEVLAPEKGVESVDLGENIRQEETEEQDVVKLTAEKSGRLIFTGSRLYIQDTVLIEGDLSPNLGKIVFPGSVDVRGSVLSKAMINAGEDVYVDGVVQAALVSAGKGVTVTKGVKGSQKAVLRGLNLQFEYAEEATVMAAETISCRKAMMRCRVSCNGRINPTDQGECKIVGGEIKVRDGLSAQSIGNERGIETVIQFGQDFLVEDRIAQIVRETEKLQEQILRIDEIIDKARGRPDKQSLMMNARDKKVRMLKVIEKKNVKLFLLREKFEEHFPSSIKITGELHEGTSFHSHGRSLEIKSKRTSVEVYFDRESGKICERPLK